MRLSLGFLFGLLLPFLLKGQTHELGFGLGGMYYQGDINPEVPFQQSQWAFQAFYRKNFGYHWSIRAGGLIGKVRGDDSLGSYDFQTYRNLRFETAIYEGHGLLEFNFLPYRPGRTNKGGAWTPFVFAGLLVLAGEFVWAQRFLDRARGEVKKADPRKFFKKKPPRENS